MSSRKIVRGGRVVTPSEVVAADVLIDGERIVGLVAHGVDVWSDAEIIDADGCLVFPGVVDPHTHIQLDTGVYQTADDWEIGTRTAAFGGVTTVIDFATQFEGMTFPKALDARLQECAPALIDYGLHMMITDLPRDPDTAREWLEELRDLGVPSIKLYTTYRPNYYADDATFLHTFRAMPKDMIAMVHCENDAIVTDATQRLVEAGKTSWAYHGRSRPAEAEVEAIRRVMYLAWCENTALYIVHCSTGRSLHAVSRSSAPPPIYCETCPQYFVLDDSHYAGSKAEQFILQPPLRGEYPLGTVDLPFHARLLSAISTDHCDYTLAQKQEFKEFTKTPGGLPGLETSFQLTYTYGVHLPQQRFEAHGGHKDALSLPRLAQLMSTNPARIFGLYPQKGAILPGSDADLLIYDPEPEVVIRAEEQHTIGGYTPYDGMTVKGRVRTVLSRGQVLVRDGELHGEPGRGRFLCGKPFAPIFPDIND
ncbi:MAG: dihydropyrimidinase [Anaerolineae bacterium]|nr:dihydropyrimidinase [Anaerolineae bacterium]